MNYFYYSPRGATAHKHTYHQKNTPSQKNVYKHSSALQQRNLVDNNNNMNSTSKTMLCTFILRTNNQSKETQKVDCWYQQRWTTGRVRHWMNREAKLLRSWNAMENTGGSWRLNNLTSKIITTQKQQLHLFVFLLWYVNSGGQAIKGLSGKAKREIGIYVVNKVSSALLFARKKGAKGRLFNPSRGEYWQGLLKREMKFRAEQKKILLFTPQFPHRNTRSFMHPHSLV